MTLWYCIFLFCYTTGKKERWWFPQIPYNVKWADCRTMRSLPGMQEQDKWPSRHRKGSLYGRLYWAEIQLLLLTSYNPWGSDYVEKFEELRVMRVIKLENWKSWVLQGVSSCFRYQFYLSAFSFVLRFLSTRHLGKDVFSRIKTVIREFYVFY